MLHWGDNEKLDKGSFHALFYTPETFQKKQVNQKDNHHHFLETRGQIFQNPNREKSDLLEWEWKHLFVAIKNIKVLKHFLLKSASIMELYTDFG